MSEIKERREGDSMGTSVLDLFSASFLVLLLSALFEVFIFEVNEAPAIDKS